MLDVCAHDGSGLPRLSPAVQHGAEVIADVRQVPEPVVQFIGLPTHEVPEARLLDKLGLDRVPRRVKSLNEYLAEKYTEGPANGSATELAAADGRRGDVPEGTVAGEGAGSSLSTHVTAGSGTKQNSRR